MFSLILPLYNTYSFSYVEMPFLSEYIFYVMHFYHLNISIYNKILKFILFCLYFLF